VDASTDTREASCLSTHAPNASNYAQSMMTKTLLIYALTVGCMHWRKTSGRLREPYCRGISKRGVSMGKCDEVTE